MSPAPAAQAQKSPLEAMLERSAEAAGAFPAGSRYHGVARGVHEAADGRTTPYLRRRIVAPDPPAVRGETRVGEGDRPDLLAARAFGDPERYWELCDANLVLRPAQLTERPGTAVRIPMPPGVGGGPDG